MSSSRLCIYCVKGTILEPLCKELFNICRGFVGGELVEVKRGIGGKAWEGIENMHFPCEIKNIYIYT